MSLLSATSSQEIAREDKERELSQLLRSGIVREHSNLYLLLEWLGRKGLENSAEPLKEYTIGLEALGKPQDYDPRLDPTVRVDIGRLRTKLREYYQGAGAARAIHLEIPKGRYDVRYSRVPTPAPLQFPVETPAPTPGRRYSYLIVAALTLALAAAAATFFYHRLTAQAVKLSPELQTFWQPYLQDATPTLLVYGTPMFVRLDRYLYREPRLNNWEEVEQDDEVNRIVKELGTTEKRPSFKFTGVGEAEALFRLTRLLTEHRAPLAVKRSNNLSWEDLKGRHIVLLGSQKYNPQILKFPFTPKFEADRGRVTNLSPAPGEVAEYPNIFRDKYGEPVETYAVITVFPGLDPNTRVTILSCSSNEGTGGAAEYVTRPDTLKELFQRLNLAADAPLPKAFQAVIRVRLNDSVPVQMSYVTHHIAER